MLYILDNGEKMCWFLFEKDTPETYNGKIWYKFELNTTRIQSLDLRNICKIILPKTSNDKIMDPCNSLFQMSFIKIVKNFYKKNHTRTLIHTQQKTGKPVENTVFFSFEIITIWIGVRNWNLFPTFCKNKNDFSVAYARLFGDCIDVGEEIVLICL